MINESSISLLKDMEPFGRQKLLKVLEGQYKEANLTSYKLKMQRLLKSRQSARVGKNLCCIPNKIFTLEGNHEYHT